MPLTKINIIHMVKYFLRKLLCLSYTEETFWLAHMGKTYARNLGQQNKKSPTAKEEVATKHKPSTKPNEKYYCALFRKYKENGGSATLPLPTH